MPLPVRSLTVLQNWDCGACTACCRQYLVTVSPEERARIEAQGWDKEPDFAGVSLFVRTGGWFSSNYCLNHRPDGACVFLGPDNRCRIHVKHGSAAKPLACRIYPYHLIPAGDHWNLGLRFACPSAATDEGRPLAEHLPEARQYAAALEEQIGTAALTRPPPPLQRSQPMTWSDLGRIITAISKLLADVEDTPERRWRKVLFLVAMLRKAKFDGRGDDEEGRHWWAAERTAARPLRGHRGRSAGCADRSSRAWVGGANGVSPDCGAVYARKDSGADRGPAQAERVRPALLGGAVCSRRGAVPRVHSAIGSVTFADAEKPLPELSDSAVSLLTRWSRVKVESGQFCGPTNFGLPVWDGLESLAAAFAAVMWLARLLVAGGRSADDAVIFAVRMVDDNFGFNKLLGSARQKFALRLLGSRGELPRLVAWYGKTAAE